MTEAMTAGEVVTKAEVGAEHAGGYPVNSAIHDATSPPAWDIGQGLDSALGGQDVHALRSNGAEILPMVVSSGSMMILAETSDASRGTTDETNWVSHPSGIGYRRAGYLASRVAAAVEAAAAGRTRRSRGCHPSSTAA